MVVTATRIIGRAWQIYVAHCFFRRLSGRDRLFRPEILRGREYAASFDVKIFLDRPAEVLYEGLILKFKPVNMDVLPLYIVLMLASPIMLVANRPNKAFVDESPEQARARRVREGVPPVVIESILAIGAYQRAGGKTVTITNTVADLTGRPPRTVAEFIQENASVFTGR